MLLALATVLTLWLSTAGIARTHMSLTVGVCNDDWASKGSNLADMIAAGCQVIFIQEGKAAHYRDLHDDEERRLLPFGTWGVVQDTSSAARAGSVICYQHAVVRSGGRGWTFGAKAPGIMARWVAWLRAVLLYDGRPTRRRLFLFSAHWPPMRVRRFQPLFSAALWARLRLAHLAGRLIIGGVDSNQHGGPRLPAWLRWVTAAHGSIDGLIFSAKHIEVIESRDLPKDTSDHHPQVHVLRIAL